MFTCPFFFLLRTAPHHSQTTELISPASHTNAVCVCACTNNLNRQTRHRFRSVLRDAFRDVIIFEIWNRLGVQLAHGDISVGEIN